MAQTSNPDPDLQSLPPLPYRALRGRPDRWYLMTVLPEDAAAAVRGVMGRLGISASGAVHHLVRLGAGLPPLI